MGSLTRRSPGASLPRPMLPLLAGVVCAGFVWLGLASAGMRAGWASDVPDGGPAAKPHGTPRTDVESPAGDDAKEHDSGGHGADAHGSENDGGKHDGHADHDAHHDEFDLSHGNASPALEDPKAATLDMATATLIVFLILMAVLVKFAWRPIMQGLEQRERSIAEMIAEAKRNHAESQRRLEEYEAKLAEASHEAQQMIAEARKGAEAAAERIRYEAEAAARRERERAVQEIQLAKEQALQELADRVASQAFLVARRVLDREVKPEDHQRLVREALEQLPSEN